jgi:hypothetical protein
MKERGVSRSFLTKLKNKLGGGQFREGKSQMKLTKDYLIKLIKEEVTRVEEAVTRAEVEADFMRMMPDASPEQIKKLVDDYMEIPTSNPKKRGAEFGKPGYGEFPAEPEEYTLKQGFKDVLGQAFSMEEEKLDPKRPGMKAGETEEEFAAAVRRDAKEREARKKKRKEREDVAAAKRKAVQRAMRRG